MAIGMGVPTYSSRTPDNRIWSPRLRAYKALIVVPRETSINVEAIRNSTGRPFEASVMGIQSLAVPLA
ncbi:hypothetical protein D3C81_627520 [compost metagenome]